MFSLNESQAVNSHCPHFSKDASGNIVLSRLSNESTFIWSQIQGLESSISAHCEVL